MAFPFPIQGSYVGMTRDHSRDQLPAGFVWNLVDFFPNILDAPLRKRGGWTYGSPTLAGSAVDRMINAEFSAGSQLLAVDNQNPAVLWTVTSATSAASAGSLGMGTSTGQPFFHANRVLFPNQDGSTAPASFTGGAPGTLAGSPPAGMYGTVYKDRSILANTTAQPKRVYFSAAGNPVSWDTTAGWIQVSRNVSGLAALRNVLLVFSSSGTERIRGSTPPPGTDMILEKVSDYGCIDHRSIALWNDKAVYADTDGIYLTDGASSIDLTAAGGMQTYWRELQAGYTTLRTLTGLVARNYYFMFVCDSSSFVDCLVCDLPARTWFRLGNMGFRCAAQVHGAFQDFYGGLAGSGRVGRLTDIFNPSATNQSDADATPVEPVVEYPMARGFVRRPGMRRWIASLGLTRWQRLWMTYDLRDPSGNSPTLTISYVKTPEQTAYTNLVYPLTTSTAMKRTARSFGVAGERGGTLSTTLGVKIKQTGASADTRLYSLEAVYQVLEVGQVAS